MFGLGFGEIVVILILALVLLGPTRLPDAAKQLGKGLREFKKATDDLKAQFEGELYADPRPASPRRSEPMPLPGAAPEAPPQLIPPGAVPAGAPAPAATVDNVPGLEAALAEPTPPAPPPVKPEPAPQRPAEEKAT